MAASVTHDKKLPGLNAAASPGSVYEIGLALTSTRAELQTPAISPAKPVRETRVERFMTVPLKPP